MDYIECSPGMEEGPAIEDVAPYCVPADEAVPGGFELNLPGFPDSNGDGVDDRLAVDPPIVEPPVEVFPPALPLDGARELAVTGLDDVTVLITLVCVVVLLAVGAAIYWMDKHRWNHPE